MEYDTFIKCKYSFNPGAGIWPAKLLLPRACLEFGPLASFYRHDDDEEGTLRARPPSTSIRLINIKEKSNFR